MFILFGNILVYVFPWGSYVLFDYVPFEAQRCYHLGEKNQDREVEILLEEVENLLDKVDILLAGY